MVDVAGNVTSVHRRDGQTDLFDPNTRCMHFGTYEDDVLKAAEAQWIYCKCTAVGGFKRTVWSKV